MSERRLPIHRKDIEKIERIIQENDVHAFELIGDAYESGIGYTLDMEFDHEINGRPAKVRISITDESDW